MGDVSVIDHFLDVFSKYIDSGFGLLHAEVAYLTAALVVIDITLAGLFWAASKGGSGEDVIARLIKKTLYIGTFSFIIGNFNALAGILFKSFAGLGLLASGSGMSPAEFLHPGHLAKIGVDAAHPIMVQLGDLTGFPEVFVNLDTIVVLFLAWLVVIVSFFVLSVQLFVTLIEFKLTTLAGLVLVPFAFWNKTAFLAERVLGNVFSSGIKVLVLAVILGIGSGLFGEFKLPDGAEPSIDDALTIMLASLAMLGLGIFGPGIANGLVSGAPQLGAGAAAGTALGVAGMAAAGGAAFAAGSSTVAAGARLAPSAARSAVSLATGAKDAYKAGAMVSGEGSAIRAAGAGLANVAKTGASAVKSRVASAVAKPAAPAAGAPTTGAPTSGATAAASAPAWAKQLQSKRQIAHGATTAVHALRSGDHAGSGVNPSLSDDSSS